METFKNNIIAMNAVKQKSKTKGRTAVCLGLDALHNVVEGLVLHGEDGVGMLLQLVHRKHAIVRRGDYIIILVSSPE